MIKTSKKSSRRRTDLLRFIVSEVSVHSSLASLLCGGTVEVRKRALDPLELELLAEYHTEQ